MFKKLAFLLAVLLMATAGRAQNGPAATAVADTGLHMQISLITCGPGHEEVYEVFGHTAIRIVDSMQHTDMVYNYGTFAYGKDFEIQFMRGKLLYYLSVYPFSDFVPEYVAAKRTMEEQVLLLTDRQKVEIASFLEWNAEPAHREYKYDFFFDNCATRIRDIFPKTFGNGFVFGSAVDPKEKITFRDIINRYFYSDHWTRVGVNLLLGSKIDKVMSNMEIMFLPDYLRDGVRGATVSGHSIAAAPVVILPGDSNLPAGMNTPFIAMCIIAILTIAGLTVKPLWKLGEVMSSLLLLVTGLLGILMLVMWFWTDHQACGNNLNILWCLPTNIVIAFFNPKGKPRYALVGIFFIFISLLLHVLKIQALTLLELSPVLLSLLFIYGTIYKRRNTKNTIVNA